MREEERAEIIDGIRFVDAVLIWQQSTVDEVIRTVRPRWFLKGGDRDSPERIPEWATCQGLGVQVVTGVGGGKIAASSELLAAYSAARAAEAPAKEAP